MAKQIDWQQFGERWHAWYITTSHHQGAVLASRIVPLGDVDVSVRAIGVRVAVAADTPQAQQIADIAAESGLTADPAAVREMSWVIETSDAGVARFWQTATGYQESTGDLIDPLQRDPNYRFEALADARPLRSRLHFDVARPADLVEAARRIIGQQPSGPWGVALSDPDGNEVDLCPGGGLSDQPEHGDWITAFSAMAYYPATPEQSVALTEAVAKLADETGIPLLIDVRAAGVMIDSGKDQWEGPAGPDPAFLDLAAQVQSAARQLGLTADPSRVGFVQVGIDVTDVPAARAFWSAVLGYRYDPRPGVTDLYDPRRLDPVIFFQELDATDEARVTQRNRIRLRLTIPHQRLPELISKATDAGGRIVEHDDQAARCLIADPDNNELDLIGG